MSELIPRVRKPVQREGARRYLLYTLLSFAISVSLTRLFLELTGYPQLGRGGLHIAHVLWGGLLLFIAALIPMLFANRWAFTLDSVLAGVGVGLFIDEVGKFITQTNNYFYPPAAPIIYAFFLLVVLVYIEMRRRREHDVRTELYAVLDELEEVLDHDLSDLERTRILARLERLRHRTDNENFERLIKELHDFVNCQTLYMVPHQPIWWERYWGSLQRLEARWLNRRGLQFVLAGGLIAIGFWSLISPILIGIDFIDPNPAQPQIANLMRSGLIQGPTSLEWFEIRLALQAVVGGVLIISAFLMVFGKDILGVAISRLSLLVSLTMVNLLMFYFDQFSTIITASLQFILFLAISYYHSHYVKRNLSNRIRQPTPQDG